MSEIATKIEDSALQYNCGVAGVVPEAGYQPCQNKAEYELTDEATRDLYAILPGSEYLLNHRQVCGIHRDKFNDLIVEKYEDDEANQETDK